MLLHELLQWLELLQGGLVTKFDFNRQDAKAPFEDQVDLDAVFGAVIKIVPPEDIWEGYLGHP